MAKKIKPVDLNKAVEEVLNQYGDEVYKVMGESIKEVAEEATNRLKQSNSFAPGGHPTGVYAQDWINEELQSKALSVSRVVHNQEHYRLTHLLEKGHVIRNGTGRTFGKTGAYPHIGPVNDWANKELPNLVKRKLET